MGIFGPLVQPMIDLLEQAKVSLLALGLIVSIITFLSVILGSNSTLDEAEARKRRKRAAVVIGTAIALAVGPYIVTAIFNYFKGVG